MGVEKLLSETINIEHALKDSQELVVALLTEIDKLRLELESANNKIAQLSYSVNCIETF